MKPLDIALHTLPSVAVGALMGFMAAFGFHQWPSVSGIAMVVASVLATATFSWLWVAREHAQHGGGWGTIQSKLEGYVPLISGPVAYVCSTTAFYFWPL